VAVERDELGRSQATTPPTFRARLRMTRIDASLELLPNVGHSSQVKALTEVVELTED
jgi:hypothetical protein